jgi:hypothetical protein
VQVTVLKAKLQHTLQHNIPLVPMALAIPRSPLPAICISPAPYQAPAAEEPKSPFNCLSPLSPAEDDGFRSALLTPPPVLSPGRASPLSPLRPTDVPATTGLARERFEAMLQKSRERNVMIGGSRKVQDLRKEIALKAHKSKQSERRALFLSKLQAPPSPSAAMLPKTPPESPAILHYSMPSPGLTSPLALYDTLSEAELKSEKAKGWVEQVDFRLPEGQRVRSVTKAARAKPLPSLAQISARLAAQGHLPQIAPVHVVLPELSQKTEPAPRVRRLPAFLQKEAPQKKVELVVPVVIVEPPAAPPARPRALLSIGRLKAPVRSTTPAAEPVKPQTPPKSPGAPRSPDLRITTTVVPRTSSTSPVDLTESNLSMFNARAKNAKDMLSTLRRRNGTPNVDGMACDDLLLNKANAEEEDASKNLRRRSAPAELPKRARREFAHPVLNLPGAF